jgi:3-mercaptopyruvate sulfurtransferase SseA
MALRFADLPFRSVRPLEGGFDAWVDAGFPVHSLATSAASPLPSEPAPGA